MEPLRLNRIQPGALFRQKGRQNANTSPLLLDLVVVFTNPSAYVLTAMLGGVIPDQQPCRFALRLQVGATPVQKLCRKIKASDERNPAWIWRCSSSVRGRLKMGVLMFSRVGDTLLRLTATRNQDSRDLLPYGSVYVRQRWRISDGKCPARFAQLHQLKSGIRERVDVGRERPVIGANFAWRP